jgi:hypothetical protein
LHNKFWIWKKNPDPRQTIDIFFKQFFFQIFGPFYWSNIVIPGSSAGYVHMPIIQLGAQLVRVFYMSKPTSFSIKNLTGKMVVVPSVLLLSRQFWGLLINEGVAKVECSGKRLMVCWKISGF